jgi:hypothetical protein
MRILFLFLVLASFSFAEVLTLGKPNEVKEHSPWLNMGIGIGVLSPTTGGYKNQGSAFVNPSLLLGIQFAEFTAATFEFDFTKPNGGWGFWFGVEQQFMETDITPFAEIQIGAKYPGKHKRVGMEFGDVFGAAVGTNAGIIFFRESAFRLRLKGGYEGIFNKNNDMAWKAGIAVLLAFGEPGLKTIKTN